MPPAAGAVVAVAEGDTTDGLAGEITLGALNVKVNVP